MAVHEGVSSLVGKRGVTMVTRDKKWLAGPPGLRDHVLPTQYHVFQGLMGARHCANLDK